MPIATPRGQRKLAAAASRISSLHSAQVLELAPSLGAWPAGKIQGTMKKSTRPSSPIPRTGDVTLDLHDTMVVAQSSPTTRMRARKITEMDGGRHFFRAQADHRPWQQLSAQPIAGPQSRDLRDRSLPNAHIIEVDRDLEAPWTQTTHPMSARQDAAAKAGIPGKLLRKAS